MNDKMWIDYEYVHFEFLWTWIRDKKLYHQGNEDRGMLIITDENDNVVKMLGYEKVDEKE
jgi:hypothetical protein